jgi:hypothetical protein
MAEEVGSLAMHELRETTRTFLKTLEQSANRRLLHPQEVGELIEIAAERKTLQVLHDVVFLAKFISKSAVVMKRIGLEGEGYETLAAEFRVSLEKVSTLLRTLVKESPEDMKSRFIEKFFSMDHAGMERLMDFLNDLTIVKNWLLDGNELPR